MKLVQGGPIRLLEADPDLGDGLEGARLEAARTRLVVQTLRADPGELDPGDRFGDGGDQLGVLIAGGLVTRDVVIAATTCAELVGAGDVVLPWTKLGEGAPIPSLVEWHVLEPTTFAVLDGRFVAGGAAYPEIMAALVKRAVTRAQTLAVSLAISCITGLKLRLLASLWHLADRYGRVGPDGVAVPVPLTHQTIGRLVGATRPSVSTALKELENEGRIGKRQGGGFILFGGPPELELAMADRRQAVRSARRRAASGSLSVVDERRSKTG
ncbi:MAG: Crp/Fnr family transcriptional regulator [Thermoleophilaceae bacterium]